MVYLSLQILNDHHFETEKERNVRILKRYVIYNVLVLTTAHIETNRLKTKHIDTQYGKFILILTKMITFLPIEEIS